MAEWFLQSPHGVRFEWGLAGAAALAPSSSCLVIVDVLSFTTSVTVAVEAGRRVFPYAWRDETAADFARRHQARLAADHRTASDLLGAGAVIAAEINSCRVVPVLTGQAFIAAV
jgi:2-phosphosulfolactate phosphatase